MTWLSLLLLISLPVGENTASIPQEASRAIPIERNPFRSLARPIVADDEEGKTKEDVASPAIDPSIQSASQAGSSLEPALAIENQLRSIAIRKNGKKIALFGERIVEENGEIDGYRVAAISLDCVVLRKGSSIAECRLDEMNSRRKSKPATAGRGSDSAPWDRIVAPLLQNDSQGNSSLSDWIENYQSLTDLLKPLLERNAQTDRGTEPVQ